MLNALSKWKINEMSNILDAAIFLMVSDLTNEHRVKMLVMTGLGLTDVFMNTPALLLVSHCPFSLETD